METLVQNAADRLGLEARVVKQALRALFCFLRDKQRRGEISVDIEQMVSLLIGGGKNDSSSDDWMNDENTTTTRSSSSSKGEEESQRHPRPTTIWQLLWFILGLFGILHLLKQVLSHAFPPAVRWIETLEDGYKLDQLLRQRFGMTHEQGMVLVGMLVNFMKQNLQPETVDSLLQHVPALLSFANEGNKKQKRE